MSEFHVIVAEITSIEKHSNADTLDILKINDMDYPIISKSGLYNLKDKVVYIPVDSVLPETPEWEWLGKHKRIKAKKLRGVFSMGLVTPAKPEWTLGQNVQEELGIIKYEPDPFAKNGVSRPGGKLDNGENHFGPLGFHFPEYTDIESIRKNNKVLLEGEEVILLEKLHGCVSNRAKITLADGSKKVITQIKIGDEVLGMKSDGQVVVTKVTNVFNNGKCEKWLKVSGTRTRAGRGGAEFTVYCTPNHKFWNPILKDYINADNLKPGDKCNSLRTDLGLLPIQKSILLGIMLGDGNLQICTNTATITWGHKEADSQYNDWIARGLGDLINSRRDNLVSGYGTPMERCRTQGSVFTKQYFSSFIKNKLKVVPKWVSKELDPIAIAFWYMDDGSLGHDKGQEDRANFAVCAFTKQDCDVLLKGLAKFNIIGTYYTTGGYSRIRLNSEEAEKLFLLIAPYIPPCMQYKLPERYRGHSGWLPALEESYKSPMVEQTILEVRQDLQLRSTKYDIETETHNYFVNDILTHNSNSRAIYVPENRGLWYGSHHKVKEPGSDHAWSQAGSKYNLKEKLAKYPLHVFYFETYGQVQDLTYGAAPGELFIAIFDIFDSIKGTYLNFDDMVKILEELDLPMVPILYRGPWENELKDLAEGNTTIPNADNIREGFVARVPVERWDDRCGRVILKLVGQNYLLRP